MRRLRDGSGAGFIGVIMPSRLMRGNFASSRESARKHSLSSISYSYTVWQVRKCSNLIRIVYILLPRTIHAMKRSNTLKIGFALALTILMSGWASGEEVWQPSDPDAKATASPGQGDRGITVQLTEDVSLSFTPVSIDRKDNVRFTVTVAPGATLWLVSDQIKVESAGNVFPIALQYQGTVTDFTTDPHQPGVYQLVGRKSAYSFVALASDIKGDVFYLTLPLLADPDDDLNALRIRFHRRRVTSNEGH
jgi:hypothetical protein